MNSTLGDAPQWLIFKMQFILWFSKSYTYSIIYTKAPYEKWNPAIRKGSLCNRRIEEKGH